jgi:uncharacterized protein (PEP-CTERM system associated)
MLRIAAILTIALVSGAATADPIIARAGVLSRLIFTDNLFLNREGKESDVILQLLPNISGGRAGSRANYRFYYGPSLLFYGGGNSNLNRMFHVLQADGAVQLIDEYLGLRASARANQNLVNPNQDRAGFDAVGNPDAFAQTASIRITPVIRLPIRSDYAVVQIEPGIDYVFSSDTADGRSNQGDVGSRSSISVRSGEYFSRTTWSVIWRANVFNTGNSGSRTNYETLYGTVSYRVDRNWQIEGLAGYDNGSYASQNDTRSPRWRITPTWTPSANTTLAFGYGRRYEGNDWYLRLRHQFKKLVVSAEYETVLSDARTQLLTQDVVQFEDPFGEPIRDPLSNQELSGSINNPSLVNDVFVLQRLRGMLGYRFGRNNLTLRLWRDNRTYQESDLDYVDDYSILELVRAMNPRMNGSIRLDLWGHQEDTVNSVDFTQYRASLQLSYRVNERTSTSILYSYLNRASDSDLQDYDENRLMLTLNWAL